MILPAESVQRLTRGGTHGPLQLNFDDKEKATERKNDDDDQSLDILSTCDYFLEITQCPDE